MRTYMLCMQGKLLGKSLRRKGVSGGRGVLRRRAKIQGMGEKE